MLARQQTRGQLGSNGRLGRRCVFAGPRSLDHFHRQAAAHIAGDQQLLDSLPIGVRRPTPKDASNASHEAAAAAGESGRQVARRIHLGSDGQLGFRTPGLAIPTSRGQEEIHLTGRLRNLNRVGRAGRAGRLDRRFCLVFRSASEEQGGTSVQPAGAAALFFFTRSASSRASSRRRLMTRLTASSPTVMP